MAVDQRVGSAVRRTDRGSGSGGERITCPDAAGRQGAGRDRLDLEQRHVWIRRLGNVKSTGSDTFVYDAFGRLTSGTAGAAHSQAYTYDVFGNILTITTDGSTATRANLGVDPATNRISRSSDPVTGAPYNAFGTYDARGNMISNALGDTFRYDALDRLAESTVGGVRKVYLYGPDDERIASFTISPSWSADWTLRDPGGRVLRRYRQSGNGDWSWSQDYIYRDGQLLASAVTTTEKVRHFHRDHLGTPRLITGNGGAELSRHTNYPFGQQVAPVPADAESMKFTGHERDAASLDYMHARYYSPVWGRFLSVDPTWDSADVSRPQSWNRYSYVLNNSVNLTDPDGRCPQSLTGRRCANPLNGAALVLRRSRANPQNR